METFKFPENFLWGSATSSYQVEGGIDNNDWAEAARAGRVPPAGRACDHYNRYEADFDMAKESNQNAHRFSIEWARVEPEEGKFSEEAIEHYRKVLDALRERGLEPFVTLWHFTLPIWFVKKGGFENSKAPEIFARYCGYVAEKLGDRARFWMTINEPMVYVGAGYLQGEWPPFKRNFFTFWKVIKTLISSHLASYNVIKQKNPALKIGIAKNNIYFEGWPILSYLWNFYFLNKIKNHMDFIGLNYYVHQKFPKNKNKEVSEMGWEIYPEGIFHVLKDLKRYNKPIYITENGLADAKDAKREKFIKDHLYWVWRAIQDGVDVRGYMHWSLLDNFEWAKGFDPKFGLVEVDFQTMERKIRLSAWEYAKICQNNTLSY